MQLTQQDRELYSQLIQNLYGGAVRSAPSQINQEVVEVVNTIFNQAIECSKAISITTSLLSLISPGSAFTGLTRFIVNTYYDAIVNWVGEIANNRTGGACIQSAKLNYRSPLEIALLGL